MCKIHVASDVVIAVNARLRETLLILFTFMPSELICNESYYLMSLKIILTHQDPLKHLAI